MNIFGSRTMARVRQHADVVQLDAVHSLWVKSTMYQFQILCQKASTETYE
jgi:hypothetical protein